MPGNFYYWDACVPLSFLDEARTDRHPHIRWWLDEAAKTQPTFELVTSMLSLTEVAYGAAEKVKGILDPAIEQEIDKLWFPSGPIRFYEYHETIALAARDLSRMATARKWRLAAPDAIHLATARAIGAKEFHTYDHKLFRWSSIVGIPILEPYVANPKTL